MDGIDGERFRDLFDSSQGFALSVLCGGKASGEKAMGCAVVLADYGEKCASTLQIMALG